MKAIGVILLWFFSIFGFIRLKYGSKPTNEFDHNVAFGLMIATMLCIATLIYLYLERIFEVWQ